MSCIVPFLDKYHELQRVESDPTGIVYMDAMENDAVVDNEESDDSKDSNDDDDDDDAWITNTIDADSCDFLTGEVAHKRAREINILIHGIVPFLDTCYDVLHAECDPTGIIDMDAMEVDVVFDDE